MHKHFSVATNICGVRCLINAFKQSKRRRRKKGFDLDGYDLAIINNILRSQRWYGGGSDLNVPRFDCSKIWIYLISIERKIFASISINNVVRLWRDERSGYCENWQRHWLIYVTHYIVIKSQKIYRPNIIWLATLHEMYYDF